jgi:hypothetical protein
MTRYRKIRKYGDTWVIKLNPIDAKDFDLKEEMDIDIESTLLCHLQTRISSAYSDPHNKQKLQNNQRK